MKQTFVNFSNHPSSRWSDKQLLAAKEYGEVIDVAFPAVCATASKTEIDQLAASYVADIVSYSPAAVMCQGEFTLCYAVVCRLKNLGIEVLAACSERMVEEMDGRKVVTFEFMQFRAY